MLTAPSLILCASVSYIVSATYIHAINICKATATVQKRQDRVTGK